jgi:hypothetical protein
MTQAVFQFEPDKKPNQQPEFFKMEICYFRQMTIHKLLLKGT